MASQTGGNLSRIETGPCKLTFKNLTLGHTQGGIRFNITPQIRDRNVDEYGSYRADVIHTGDDVTISTTLAEKTLAVLQTVYAMSYGALSSTLVGIGQLPGGKGSNSAGPLLIHPLSAGENTDDDVLFYKCVVTETGEVQFGTFDDDRSFDATWVALIDETREAGQLLGQIGVAAT